MLIGPQHVGTVIAQFLMRECKPPQWRLLPSDKRGHAQAAARSSDEAIVVMVNTLFCELKDLSLEMIENPVCWDY